MGLTSVLGIYVALVGLVIGSYLNVLIYRLPRGLSTVLPRSRCPRCQSLIRAWDNLPLLSFLLLRGRCRACAAPIPWRYPLVEALTATCFVLVFLHFDRWLELVVAAGFSAAMIALAMIDLEHFLLPDVMTKTGIVVGLLLQAALFWAGPAHWLSWTQPRDAFLGALLGAGVLYAISWLWYLWRKVPGIGLGDVKMLAMIGAFLGWQGALITLFFGALAGSLCGALLLLRGQLHLQSKLPFGVFLALGAVLSLLWGPQWLAAYLAFSGLGPP